MTITVVRTINPKNVISMVCMCVQPLPASTSSRTVITADDPAGDLGADLGADPGDDPVLDQRGQLEREVELDQPDLDPSAPDEVEVPRTVITDPDEV